MGYIKRYIDADKLVADMYSSHCTPIFRKTDADIMFEEMVGLVVNQIPADVVEVPCRCAKCKYRITHTCPITGIETLFCDYGEKPVAVEPTHFCSYGERREG